MISPNNGRFPVSAEATLANLGDRTLLGVGRVAWPGTTFLGFDALEADDWILLEC
jgi:hypothetical protein